MLVSFSLSNYRSFKQEATFSMVASKKLSGRHEDHVVPIPNSEEKALRTAAIYGANGSGKSNLLRAIKYMQRLVLQSGEKGQAIARDAFEFQEDKLTPTVFDIQFVTNKKLYRYGIKVDDDKVAEEWLLEIKGKKEITIYERVTDPKGKVKLNPHAFKGKSESLQSLAKVGGPINQSFLATILININAEEWGDDIKAAIMWFVQGIVVINPTSSFLPMPIRLSKDEDFKKFVSAFLKNSSTGVDEIEVTETIVSAEDVSKILDDESVSNRKTEILSSLGSSKKQSRRLGAGKWLVKDGEDLRIVTLRGMHIDKNGKKYALNWNDESDGTKRLIDIIPALYYMDRTETAYLIDEIDRSLHPELAHIILEFFLERCTGHSSQLIITTHESNLLNLNMLRRDEIWFAEKDDEANTHLYPLSDYKIRNDLEIRKHYLQGRFGAIPFLGNLKNIIEEHAAD